MLKPWGLDGANPSATALVWKCPECLNNWSYTGSTIGHSCAYGPKLGLKEQALLCMFPWVISGKSLNFSEFQPLTARWDLTTLFFLRASTCYMPCMVRLNYPVQGFSPATCICSFWCGPQFWLRLLDDSGIAALENNNFRMFAEETSKETTQPELREGSWGQATWGSPFLFQGCPSSAWMCLSLEHSIKMCHSIWEKNVLSCK